MDICVFQLAVLKNLVRAHQLKEQMDEGGGAHEVMCGERLQDCALFAKKKSRTVTDSATKAR